MGFVFRQHVNLAEEARRLTLAVYTPGIALEGLTAGVDNLRHDVSLSPKFAEMARTHLARLIAKYGMVEDLAGEVAPPAPRPSPLITRNEPKAKPPRPFDPGDFKRLLSELHVVTLNRAKADGNLSLDLLARLAIIKFLRAELPTQFAQVQERCRVKLKEYEGPRSAFVNKAVELRERFANFRVSKKTVLRKASQDIFQTLREVEKETLAHMRRSLFGEEATATYDLFTNRLLFTEDGHDDLLNAEHYIMLGNYETDSDRFMTMLLIVREFLRSMEIGDGEEAIEAYLSAPENAQELVAGGSPEESTPKGHSQKLILNAWVDLLEREEVMGHVIASYEVVPLLKEYAAINPQQLKNALINKTERQRVEGLLEEHGRIRPDNLLAAVKRVGSCKGSERAKVAGRFLFDFMRYFRDLRRMEAVNMAMASVNVLASEKLRELSAINNTLYEFLLPEEQKPAEDKIIHHTVIKADIRDSTTLTRTLFERGLNPASYFSLNFYEPINKLLPKYAATKVFLEGDAVILALFERENEPPLGVAQACVLAKEIIEIVRGYNEQSQKAGLPTLELGIGISYQDSSPMYLMDGNSRIMISKALNESDRLSSCSKGARKYLAEGLSLFNVHSFQTVADADTAGNPDEFLMRYNIGGIHISEPAFQKLRTEISLQELDLKAPTLWKDEKMRLYSGLVPVGAGSFHKIAVREAFIPHIDARDFSLKDWTNRRYYEVCTTQVIYEYLEMGREAATV